MTEGPAGSPNGSVGAAPGHELPIHDRFEQDADRGTVFEHRTTSGHRRYGADPERVLSIDGGRLRIRPLVHPGWGRSALRYGPVLPVEGLVCSVVALNGRNGSEDVEAGPSALHWAKQAVRGTQSDSPARRLARRLRFEGRDSLVRRLRSAHRHSTAAPESRSDDNFAVHWSSSARASDPLAGPGFVVRATGADNAQLCIVDRGRLVPVVDPLPELALRLAIVIVEGKVHYLGAIDGGDPAWPALRPLATTIAPPADRPGWLVVQQRVLGQVGWGMDSRIDEVRIDRVADTAPLASAIEAAVDGGARLDLGSAGACGVPSRIHHPGDGTAVADRFEGQPGDLADHDGPLGRWRQITGRRPVNVIAADGGAGGAEVGPLVAPPEGRLARLVQASGQRTAYVVDGGPSGWIETEITPPGSGRGEGHGGRAGLVLYQDPDNYLIVNDWLDDSYPGASVSVFRRLDGYEEVYDAVWVNVGDRIRWGRPHRLAVGYDPESFTAFLDGAPVLTRAHRDQYPAAPTLRVTAVGIAANWEFGDDTGSRFSWFSRQ